jgi:hypothetical protein
VLTYIRSQWGNNAGPVDPQVVKAARAEARPNYESSDELLKIAGAVTWDYSAT